MCCFYVPILRTQLSHLRASGTRKMGRSGPSGISSEFGLSGYRVQRNAPGFVGERFRGGRLRGGVQGRDRHQAHAARARVYLTNDVPLKEEKKQAPFLPLLAGRPDKQFLYLDRRHRYLNYSTRNKRGGVGDREARVLQIISVGEHHSMIVLMYEDVR